jgi:hypothetical protein
MKATKKKKIIVSIPVEYLDRLWELSAKERITVNKYIVDSVTTRIDNEYSTENTNR